MMHSTLVRVITRVLTTWCTQPVLPAHSAGNTVGVQQESCCTPTAEQQIQYSYAMNTESATHTRNKQDGEQFNALGY